MTTTNAPTDSTTDSTDNAKKGQATVDKKSGSTTLDAQAIQQKLQELKTTTNGLSEVDAAQRLKQNGPNAIEVHEESKWKKLFAYFWGPIPWMIEAAALISLLRQDWPDFFVIFILLVYNAVVGFWQDNKAANALAALQKGLAAKAHVLRDGKWSAIDATDLVVGDIVTVSGGDIVPADLLLTGGNYLSVNQAALTGESLPVSRTVGDTIFSGSIAHQGSMTGVVSATGNNTFYGNTAKLVASAGSKSHADEAVLKIGDFLIILAVILAVILIGVQVYREIVMVGHWEWSAAGGIAQYVLVLLIASIPVAMPAVMSVTKALGAITLSKQKAIVSRLSAIEELAGVDILCSDKTGTLTLNQLTLQEPIPFNQTATDDIIIGASIACQKQSTDAIDLAVLKALKDPKALDQYKAVSFVPFDPVNKKTVGVVTNAQGQTLQFAKGAPQAIGTLCGLGAQATQDPLSIQYYGQVSTLASHGTRALGVARSDDQGKTWTLLGLLALSDPPRPDAKDTIAKAKALGLSVKMVTGDDIAIGSEMSRQLGLGPNLLVASDLFKNDKDPDHIAIDTARAVESADGFGRVFPKDKFEIVKALQQRGHIVGMTGDGVNDAPALKQADCGIAVSGATDAARSAAAIILTAPGLSTIISAIIESRKIFERITSYVYYRIAMTIAIMFVVVLSYIIFDIQPLTAIMIVMLALLDDIPIMTIAYDNVQVSPKPIRWDMHRIISFSSVMGVIALAQSFGMVLLCKYWMNNPELMSSQPMSLDQLQTMLFLQLAAGSHLLLFVVRNRGSLFSRPLPNSKLFFAIVITQIVAVLLCAFGIFVTPLSLEMIVVVWVYVLIWMFLANFVKLGYYKFMDRKTS